MAKDREIMFCFYILDAPINNGNFLGGSSQFQSPVISVPSINTTEIKYEPLDKLDLSEADFAPAVNSTTPSLADELKLAECDTLQDSIRETSPHTNGHISLSPEKYNLINNYVPQGKLESNLTSLSNDIVDESSTAVSLQNGSQDFSVVSPTRRNLNNERPEILQSTSENSEMSDHTDASSNSQQIPHTVMSDAAQGPRPDLIPTGAGSRGTAASLAACHDIHSKNCPPSTFKQEKAHNGVFVKCENVVLDHLSQQAASHQEGQAFDIETPILNVVQAPHLELPGSDIGSKENLSSDISQPSTVSSMASSVSSSVSPKHTVNIPAKDETHCDVDQVDSGIRLHNLKSDDQSRSPVETGCISIGSMPHRPTKQKPVGFGDLDEDISEENIEEELGAYLLGMEISTDIHRGTRPNISDMVQSTGQKFGTQGPHTDINKTVPKTLKLTDINKPSMNLPMAGFAGVELIKRVDSSDTNASILQDNKPSERRIENKVEDSPERRQSAESVEKFLAQTIMSPGISTPMEDAGFSRVPGYTPVDSMATLAEELEEPEALKLALEREQTSNDSIHRTVVTESAVNTDISNFTQDSSESVEETRQPGSEGHVSKMSPQTPSKSPTGIGARPKDPSQMNKKTRPNSLLGLSTPDISTQRPLVIQSKDGMETGTVSPHSNPVLNDTNPAVQNENDVKTQFAQNRMPSLQRDNLTLDIKNQFDTNQFNQKKIDSLTGDPSGFGVMSPEQHMESVYAGHTPHQPHPPPYMPPQSLSLPPPGQSLAVTTNDSTLLNFDQPQLPDSRQLDSQKQKRPTSLSLLPRGELPNPGVRPQLPDDAFQGPIQDSDSSGMLQIRNFSPSESHGLLCFRLILSNKFQLAVLQL